MVDRGVPARRPVYCRDRRSGRIRRLCLGEALRRAAVAIALTAAVAPVPVAQARTAFVPDIPIGAHSMLYLNHPYGAKAAMFREAGAMGASTIRVDVAVSGVFPDSTGRPDWTGLDEYLRLSRRYRIRVLADLLAVPWYLADCPPSTPASYRCPPSDLSVWAQDVGRIAAHTRGVIEEFEIVNEPDGRWAFLGAPQQYAWMLSASYDAIHAANPEARVALGGLMDPGSGGRAWVDAMLATPGADAAHRFDIANIHIRARASLVASLVRRWRRHFALCGFRGPLWVTEAGYPADPAWQTDPSYRGGPAAQARYLLHAVPAMIGAGAAKGFVTARDSLSGPFASEGVLQSSDPLTASPSYRRRPAFYAMRLLARRYRRSRGASREGRYSRAGPSLGSRGQRGR
jgi:hypothetical protein